MGFLAEAVRRRALITDAVRTRLWPVPAIGVAVAIATGLALPELDRVVDPRLADWASDYLFGGGADAARAVLSAVASSLITVTSLTFSLTVVTLQLASSQFSPRLLRTFARDRFVQRTLALFLATFVYALTVLRSVLNEGADTSEFVPKISVTVAYLLAVVCVVALVVFLAHLVRQIRVESMLDTVRDDARQTAGALLQTLEDNAEAGRPPVAPAHAMTVCAPATGFLAHVDEQAILRAAVDSEAVVVVHRPPGEWLVKGTPMALAWSSESGAPFEEDRAETLTECIASAVAIGDERTPVQDIGYALRQLTDVAVKALSPGINDPTTAVHALGHSAAVLSELADHRLGPLWLAGEDGFRRVLLHRPGLAELLDLAVSAPRRYGAADPDLLAAIFALLRGVAWRSHRAEDRSAVAAQLERLRRTVAGQDFDEAEQAALRQLGDSVQDALDGRWWPSPR